MGCFLHPISHAGGVDALALLRKVFGRSDRFLAVFSHLAIESKAGGVRARLPPLNELLRFVLSPHDIDSVLPTSCSLLLCLHRSAKSLSRFCIVNFSSKCWALGDKHRLQLTRLARANHPAMRTLTRVPAGSARHVPFNYPT